MDVRIEEGGAACGFFGFSISDIVEYIQKMVRNISKCPLFNKYIATSHRIITVTGSDK